MKYPDMATEEMKMKNVCAYDCSQQEHISKKPILKPMNKQSFFPVNLRTWINILILVERMLKAFLECAAKPCTESLLIFHRFSFDIFCHHFFHIFLSLSLSLHVGWLDVELRYAGINFYHLLFALQWKFKLASRPSPRMVSVRTRLILNISAVFRWWCCCYCYWDVVRCVLLL